MIHWTVDHARLVLIHRTMGNSWPLGQHCQDSWVLSIILGAIKNCGANMAADEDADDHDDDDDEEEDEDADDDEEAVREGEGG